MKINITKLDKFQSDDQFEKFKKKKVNWNSKQDKKRDKNFKQKQRYDDYSQDS